MKSTMKSAFAIIAVALMIMVAVVPMVGVVNGDAGTQYDPEGGQASTDKITMTFNLYANDAKITDNTYSVKVTWGTSNSIVLSTTSGSATKVFDETKMTGAKATVGTGSTLDTFKADSNFEVYTIGNVAAGATLSFDLKKGYAQTTSTISFYTKASSSDKVYDAVSDLGTTVYVNYDIYKNTGTAESPVYTKIGTTSSTAALDSSNSSFYVTYPLTESEVYVKVNKVTVGTTDVAFTSGYFKVVGASAVTQITADQFVFTVTGIAGMPAGKISALAGTDSGETPKNITDVKAIKDTISTGTKATFIYKLDASSASSDITYTATFGSVSITGLSGTTISFTGKAVFGAYNMKNASSINAVSAQDGLNLTFTIKDSAGTTIKSNTTTAYVAGGYYIAAVPTLNSGHTAETGDIIVPASTAYQISTTSVTAGTSTEVVAAASGTVGTTTYQLAYVSGTISNATAGYTFTVSGASKTFGLSSNKVVCTTGGAFGFYTAVDEYISFTAQSGNAFTDASSGKYYIPTAGQTIELDLVDKEMTFVFADGDGEALTASDVTIGIVNAAGTVMVKDTDYTVVNALAVKTVTLKDAALDISKLKVYFTATSSTFAATSAATAVAYTETLGVMPVSSLETTYSLYVKDANGKAIASPTITGAVVSAYVAEDGTKIYEPLTTPVTVTTTLNSVGAYEFRVASNLVNVTLSGTPANVVIFNVSKTGYYFETVPYLAKVGTDGTMTITAKTDGFTATIYKNDGVTPIANTQFKLSYTDTGTTTVYDVATTDANGKITFLADQEINDAAVITPTVATGLGQIKNILDGTNVKLLGEYYTAFFAENNIYAVTITDANGKALAKPAGTLTFSGTGVTLATAAIMNYVITLSSDAEVGDVLSVSFQSSEKAVRTFDAYTLTADDVKNGTISLVSNESTYTVSATDADGAAIKLNTTSTKVMKKVNGAAPVEITASQSIVYTATPNTTGTKITYVITAPADNEVYVADIVSNDTQYALVTGTYYAFTDNAAVAVSDRSTLTVEFGDATGASIVSGLGLNTITITDSMSNSYPSTWINGTTKWYFIGDADETYYVTATADGTSSYTFAAQYMVDGKVKAKEQTVVFTAVDAAGLPISGTFDMYTVAANGAVSTDSTSMTFDQSGQNTKIMALSATTTYKLVDNNATKTYTFVTDGTDFVANEQTVYFSFAFANGFKLPADDVSSTDVSSITYISKDGVRTTITPTEMKADEANITIDTTDVASYIVALAVDDYEGIDSIAFAGTTGNVVSDYSVVTGFVNTDAETVNVSYFKGTTQIAAEPFDLDDGYYIAAFDFVNGGYDKVLVQYYVSGVLTSQATIDAKTGYVADLVSVTPIAETLKAKVLDYGMSYVKLDFANGKVYLTADDKYSVETVDGLYVQTYKFAGWYVNGVKVTDDLNCAIDNVDTNVVSANYVLDDSKELGKDSASGVDPTVLVIGIAAVIIALIAVVYTVIQKKE